MKLLLQALGCACLPKCVVVGVEKMKFNAVVFSSVEVISFVVGLSKSCEIKTLVYVICRDLSAIVICHCSRSCI